MTDEERINFEKNKRCLILEMMKLRFEDRVYDYLESGEYKSMEELDEWIANALHQFEAERKQVKEYYDKRIYS